MYRARQQIFKYYYLLNNELHIMIRYLMTNRAFIFYDSIVTHLSLSAPDKLLSSILIMYTFVLVTTFSLIIVCIYTLFPYTPLKMDISQYSICHHLSSIPGETHEKPRHGKNSRKTPFSKIRVTFSIIFFITFFIFIYIIKN